MLSGLPGVGKSSMAWYWAQRSRQLFPDGQIYVDFAALRAERGGDVSEAVAHCLRSSASPPDSRSRRRWRSAPRGSAHCRRAPDPRRSRRRGPARPGQDVAAQGSGSAVLATSNRALDELRADGARLVTIDPWTRTTDCCCSPTGAARRRWPPSATPPRGSSRCAGPAGRPARGGLRVSPAATCP
ncbi:hypothetical protein NKH77_06230 [Streptomyces sp. M19]